MTTADTVQQRIRQGPSQVQQVLVNLQRRLEDQRLMMALKVRCYCAGTTPQHVQHLTCKFGSTRSGLITVVWLQMERDAPVDVQIGPQLYEHAPQELRSRRWMALLDTPTLATSVKHSA